VAEDVGGIALAGWDGVPTAARLADEGGDAGCSSVGEIACGVDWSDGNSGAAERAVSDVSSGALSRFHHAKRGPDWQPTIPVSTAAIANARMTLIFMGAARLRLWPEFETLATAIE
jgi:hypothetical protein